MGPENDHQTTLGSGRPFCGGATSKSLVRFSLNAPLRSMDSSADKNTREHLKLNKPRCPSKAGSPTVSRLKQNCNPTLPILQPRPCFCLLLDPPWTLSANPGKSLTELILSMSTAEPWQGHHQVFPGFLTIILPPGDQRDPSNTRQMTRLFPPTVPQLPVHSG